MICKQRSQQFFFFNLTYNSTIQACSISLFHCHCDQTVTSDIPLHRHQESLHRIIHIFFLFSMFCKFLVNRCIERLLIMPRLHVSQCLANKLSSYHRLTKHDRQTLVSDEAKHCFSSLTKTYAAWYRPHGRRLSPE